MVPLTPPQLRSMCQSSSYDSETCSLEIQFVIKGVVKDTEQADTEVHRGVLEGSQVQELLSLRNWPPPSSWQVDLFTNPELAKSPSRVFIKLNLQPPPSLPQRSVGGAESFSPLNHLSLLVTSPIQRLSGGPTLSHLISINSDGGFL